MATLNSSNMPTDSKPSSSDSVNLNVGYYLRSSGHRPANRPLSPFVIGIDSSSTVHQLSTAIQKQHGDVYLQGHCRLQCPGLIIVMGLWLVDHTGLDSYSTQQLLLSEIGLGKEGPLYPLQHNPRRGIVAMEVAEPLSVYRLEVKTFSVVVEATFKIDVLPDVRVLSNDDSDKSRKRHRSSTPPAAESSETGKRQRLFGHPTCPVYVTGPVSDSSRIFFPKPNSDIQAWLGCPGTAFFDKTRFIPPFHDLLEHFPFVGIWLPSGTAKTATLAMLFSFFDSQCSQRTRDAFRSLEIGDRKGCGQGEYLCLKFDFQPGKIETIFRAGNYLKALNAYLSKTLKAFVKRYHHQLGLQKGDGFFFSETDPIAMLYQVFDQATAQKKTLFCGIDNFDAGLLMSLATIESRKPAFWDEVKQTLEELLEALVAAPNLKLLVFGQLPVVQKGLQSLPGDHALQSAFAMTDEEMEAFFPVIAGGKEMDRTKMLGLEKKVMHGIKGPRQPSHNFSLFLHYLARDFDTDNDHNNPPSSPLLQSMLKNQKDLFVYLRQCREAAIPPFEAEVCPDLPNLMNDKNISWWLLHETGGLDFFRVKKDSRWAFGPTTNGVVRDQVRRPNQLPNPRATIRLDISSRQMFKTLPRSRDLVPLERELQSLAQGKAPPLASHMSSLLFHTPIGELADATEAVFQGMMNAYIMSGTHMNYFSQAHLILDHRKAREKEETDAPTNTDTGRGRTTDRTATTTRASKSAPATNRKAAAQSGSSGAKNDSSLAPESKDQPVRRKAAQGRSGYSDCLIVGLEDLALRTVVVIELKFLHLNGLLLGKEGKWHPRSPEKTQRLKDLNREIREAEMKDLMDMKYVYRDNKSKKNVETTVQEYFNDGKSQAKIYAEALKCGQANPDEFPVRERTNGILDSRVEVKPGSDCIVPMVFAAVGSRVISAHLKDIVTVHQYSGKPNWKPDM
ncbi:hypothetical protein C8R47DRAFT_1101214 [Mycena vitilis]|nr:hypothetical protein C8R47DRAFT_1101214 [Mycena vitilis]